MSTSPTIERSFHIKKKSRDKNHFQKGEQPTAVPPGRLPRITARVGDFSAPFECVSTLFV